jgi:hypothetical protein
MGGTLRDLKRSAYPIFIINNLLLSKNIKNIFFLYLPKLAGVAGSCLSRKPEAVHRLDFSAFVLTGFP